MKINVRQLTKRGYTNVTMNALLTLPMIYGRKKCVIMIINDLLFYFFYAR